MGLKENQNIAILLLGLGAVFVLAAALLFRTWRFYIENTKNKAMHLRQIRGNTTTTPQDGNLEAGQAA